MVLYRRDRPKGRFGTVGLDGWLVRLCGQRTLIDRQIKNGWTSLALAAARGHEEILEVLLTRGVSVNHTPPGSWSALAHATSNNHTAKLLSHGAEISHQNPDGKTTFTLAVTRGNPDVLSLFLSQGAAVETPDENRYTSLMVAAYHGHVEVASLLLDRNAKLESAENYGSTAFTVGVAQRQFGYGEVAAWPWC